MNLNNDSSCHNQNQNKKRKHPDAGHSSSLELPNSMDPRRCFFGQTLVEFFTFSRIVFLKIDMGFAKCIRYPCYAFFCNLGTMVWEE